MGCSYNRTILILGNSSTYNAQILRDYNGLSFKQIKPYDYCSTNYLKNISDSLPQLTKDSLAFWGNENKRFFFVNCFHSQWIKYYSNNAHGLLIVVNANDTKSTDTLVENLLICKIEGYIKDMFSIIVLLLNIESLSPEDIDKIKKRILNKFKFLNFNTEDKQFKLLVYSEIIETKEVILLNSISIFNKEIS